MSKRPHLTEVLGNGQDAQAPKEPIARGRSKESNSRSTKLERGEFKQLKAIIPTTLHKRVKVAAAERDMEMSTIVEEALAGWLSSKTKA